MPFGLYNAPAIFERLMERILQGLLCSICLAYLDDVIIFGKTFNEMIKNLRKAFLRLRSEKLKINPTKCIFFAKKVNLGHVFSSASVITDPEKIFAMSEWPISCNKKQLRSFLGFCFYYRKFVKGFSSLAKPLYVLTEKSVKFSWDEKCQNAFEKLKQMSTSSPILSFPKEESKFVLDTDASDTGIADAVLSQQQDGVEKVIAYFRRVLSKTERNYCVTRRELLAMLILSSSFDTCL